MRYAHGRNGIGLDFVRAVNWEQHDEYVEEGKINILAAMGDRSWLLYSTIKLQSSRSSTFRVYVVTFACEVAWENTKASCLGLTRPARMHVVNANNYGPYFRPFVHLQFK